MKNQSLLGSLTGTLDTGRLRIEAVLVGTGSTTHRSRNLDTPGRQRKDPPACIVLEADCTLVAHIV